MKKKERMRLRKQLRIAPPAPVDCEILFPPITEEQQREGLKAIELDRPQQESKIRTAIVECQEIFTRHDPVSLLTVLGLKWAFYTVDMKTQEVSEGGDAFLEYALSLATTLPVQASYETAQSEVFDKLEQLVTDIHHGASFYHAFESAGKGEFTPDKDVRAQQMISAVYQRGHSTEKHQVALIRSLFAEHSDFFLKHLGLTTDEIIDTAASLYDQPFAGVTASQAAANQMRAVVERLAQPDMLGKFPTGNSEQEMAANIRELPEVRAIIPDFATHQAAMERNPFELTITTPQQTLLLSLLSLNFGANAEFLIPPASPCWPLNSSAVLLRPIVCSGDRYYAFLPQLISRNLDKILSAYIEVTDPKYWEKFLDCRATWLELECLRLIASRLPGAVTHHSLRYELTENGTNKRMEVDGIIEYDGHVLLISAKSGQVTAPARRGALGRMKKTFSDLVADGFEQLTKAKRHLSARPGGAEFFRENGTRVVIQTPVEGRLCLPLNVTLDDLGGVAMQLDTLKQAGVLRAEELHWTVQLNDLRIITEIIESPIYFLLYWTRRIAAYDFSHFVPGEELDCLMYFLEFGLYLVGEERNGNERMVVHLTDELDAYYRALDSGLPAIKPRMNMVEGLRVILDGLEQQRDDGFTVVGMFVFGSSGKMQKVTFEMVEKLKAMNRHDGKVHQLTEYFRDHDTGLNLACLSIGDHAAVDRMLKFSFLKKYETKYTHWHTLFLVYDNGNLVRVGCHTASSRWTYDPEIEKVVAMLRESRREKMGNLRRNDICLCGSGKKFKHCCGA